MTWPTSNVDTTDLDAGTDNPQNARADLLDLAQKFNQLRAHVSAAAQGLLDDADATAMRATLGLVIGTNVQAYHAILAALAGLSPAADRLAYFTGASSQSLATLTAFARTLLDDADAATARATLGANNASNLTTGTIPSPVVVPLARMLRAEQEATYSLVSVPTTTPTTVATVNLGTVVAGDRILVTASVVGAAVSSNVQTFTVGKEAGTAAIGVSLKRQYLISGITADERLAGVIKVITGGTLTLNVRVTHTIGTDADYSGHLHAIVLNNG